MALSSIALIRRLHTDPPSGLAQFRGLRGESVRPGRCRDVQVSLVHQNASLVGVFCSSLSGLGDNRPNPRDLYMETPFCRCFRVQMRLVHEPSRANQPVHKQKRPAAMRGVWSGKRDSNSRPRPWQGRALPTELFPQYFKDVHVERDCKDTAKI